jgi:GT2 family glycosyltransferase
MPDDRLTVSVVVYRPDLSALHDTLASLAEAVAEGCRADVIGGAALDLVDNGSPDQEAALETLRSELAARLPGGRVRLLRGHGNVGYGRGHNLSILPGSAEYHLVLNPDVLLGRDALVEAMRFLDANPDVAMVAPQVVGSDGERQFLCHRYPSVGILFLRGFGPAWLRRLFRGALDRYEMRDVIGTEVVKGIPFASGCFMLARANWLRRVGGFSPAFFVYFEDNDLCLRIREAGTIAFVPSVRIVHHGGGAARKGLTHIRLFVRGAWTFFSRHGWKLA